MSYVKNYDIGSVRLETPYTHFVYELPLLSFGDVKHTVSLSLVFNSRLINENSFYMSNGYKLSLQKRLIIQGDSPAIYENGDGSRVNLIALGNLRYTFDDDSKRIIRGTGNSYILENPDYSTETYTTSGQITSIADKYGETILSYSYDETQSNKLTSITYLTNKIIRITYNNFGQIGAIEYVFNGTSVCTTALAYNGNYHAIVNHYSGVRYYNAYTSGGIFTSYSANGSTYEEYSHKLICTKGTDSLTFESFIGENAIDRTIYNFVAMAEIDKYTILDITNYNGIKTRAQFVNDKLAYSYETNQSIFPEDETQVANFTFKENVIIYSNDEIVGTQKYTDGIRMNYDDNGDRWTYNLEGTEYKLSDYIVVSGWIKKIADQTINGETSECIITLSDLSMSSGISFPLGDLPLNKWIYFTIRASSKYFSNTGFSCPMVDINLTESQALMADFRIVPQHTNEVPSECNSNITNIEDVLISSDGAITVIDSSLKFYIGDDSTAEAINYSTNPIMLNDIIKYQINQIRGSYTNEIYSCNGKSIQINGNPLTVEIGGEKISITAFSVGRRYYKGEKCYLTKNTVSNGNILLTATSYINNEEYSIQKYDTSLNLVLSTVEGIDTEYEYKYDDNNKCTGLMKRKSIGNYIINSAEYNEDNTALVSTIDEFGVVTTYTTDPTWGIVTNAMLSDGTSVTDTFDSDMCARLSRTFKKGDSEEIAHNFSYSEIVPELLGLTNGINDGVTIGSLNYDFTDFSGSNTVVRKCTAPIESHSISDDRKTLTSSYPSSDAPVYTVVHKTDNYGRTTEITGLVNNTYDINPTYNSGTYSILGINNGSGVLATSTDVITGSVTKYAYEKNRVSRIGVFNSTGTKISEEILSYDGADRVTCIECDMINSGSSIRETITYATQPTDSITDERVQAYSFLRNNVTMVSSENTYDELKRLSKKTITVGSNVITKDFAYEYTRPSGITHFRNGTAFHNYLWDCDAQLRTTTEHDYVSGGYTNTYVYDSYGRLERENNQVINQTICYTYDSIGNITKAQYYSYTTGEISGSPTSEETYSYDTSIPDKLISFKGKSISYDDNGYVKSYNGWTYTWSKGRLTKMTSGTRTDGLYTYTFSYNAKGQRTAKTYSYFPGTIYQPDYLSRETVSYEYDPTGRLVGETRLSTHIDSGTTVRKLVYLYEGSEMVGVIYTKEGVSATYYYDKNHRGDVIALLDSTGTAVVKYKYDAWGNCNRYASSNVDLAYVNPIRYRSYYYDESIGLYFLNARYYNPQWRRFISPDDSSYLDPETPNGLNLYAYCNNDPVNYVDPSGHGVIETILDVISVGLSFYDFLNNPSWKNAGWLALDVAFFFIPFIPAVSRLAKGASNIDNVVDVAHGFTKIDNLQDAIVIGNLPERVKAVAEIQGALFYPGYKPIEILESLGRTADITWSMELMARIDNSKWLIDKVWKGYKILDIGKDSRSYFKSILSFYGMEQRLLFYMRNFGKIRFLGYYLTRMIRQK